LIYRILNYEKLDDAGQEISLLVKKLELIETKVRYLMEQI